ncbi:TIGR03759 family integrating conjugative element protein [Rodentibacter myodis]|uniref:Integrating conjugative element protein n=1 Tax=Rodentibacter myodis TaxID=1907939 RepID=A0A1V3JSQ8_9PAST|nr:TIGR03759 family integrating conjugative element protein [Rodentibacter myodis]OOF59738.1 integrating conjugative element protein [Rodentibacter myodis]
MKPVKSLLLFSFVSLSLSSPVLADLAPQNTPLTKQITSQPQISTQQQTQMTSSMEDKWTEWGLTEQDWRQYETLMKQGARGIWTPNIDPLTALGVEANTEEERMHYARLLAKKEFERAEKEIAFQIAYTKIFNELYPDTLPFKVGDSQIQSGNIRRIIYFTRIDCKACVIDMMKLLNYAGDTQVDIYVVDSKKDDSKIRDWALANHINVEKVKKRQITLNHDTNLSWAKYAKGKMPAAFGIDGEGQWISLAY